MLALALSLAALPPQLIDVSLTDSDLQQLASAPFDKRVKMFRRERLGVHHGHRVVADYPCSDLCPRYTFRFVHYDVAPGAACERAGGVTMPLRIGKTPLSLARHYCVPKALIVDPRSAP